MTKLVFDYDPILYTAGSVGEERSIRVVHRVSGDEYDFSTRTAFWGHFKKKAGGWLAEYNAAKTIQRLPDEFDITDVQTPEPINNCLHTMKQMITGIKESVGASSYYGYSGKGKTFREDIATVMQYKGNRVGMLRPIHLDELKSYLVKHHACKIVEHIEADDACSIDSFDAYQKWKKSNSDKDKLVLAYVDKDYWQCAGHLYNTNQCNGVDSYEGFGWLNLNEKGDVKGRGRMWLYQQVLSGDVADNYCANSGSDMKWGEKSAYKLLSQAENDKQAWTALVKGYKLLYPAPKVITGWRGNEITVDYLSMLQENMSLAFMLRRRDDKIVVKDVLNSLGVEY
jgi:hypothetical protein